MIQFIKFSISKITKSFNPIKIFFLIYPITFAFYPVLHFYYTNKNETKFVQMIPLIIVSLFFALIIWLICQKITKSKEAHLLIAFITIFFLFSYGQIFTYIHNQYPIRMRYFDPLYLFVFLLLVLLVLKNQNKLLIKNFNSYFFLMSTLMIIYLVGQILLFEYKNPNRLAPKNNNNQSGQISNIEETQNSIRPDIYYFIFDRYARGDVLKDYFGYDNIEFENQLRQNGFFVSNNSYANHPRTQQSLTSSLNMNYLGEILPQEAYKNPSTQYMTYLFENNLVKKELKARGYQYIFKGSWWGPLSIDSQADENLIALKNKSGNNPCEMFNKNSIFFNFFKSIISFKIYYITDYNETIRKCQMNITNYQIEKISSYTPGSQPKLVITHFLLPHLPYIYNEDGVYVSEETSNTSSAVQNYITQLKFSNKIMLDIDQNLDNHYPSQKPIIIFQSDEGPIEEIEEFRQYVDNFHNAPIEAIKNHSAIFVAIKDNQGSSYPDGISPVNIFRYILNNTFKTNYPILENKIIFHRDGVNGMYDFKDFTANITNN